MPASDARALNSCLTRLWTSRVSAAYSCCSRGSYHLSFCGLKHVWQKVEEKYLSIREFFLVYFWTINFHCMKLRTGKSRKEVSFVNATPKGLSFSFCISSVFPGTRSHCMSFLPASPHLFQWMRDGSRHTSRTNKRMKTHLTLQYWVPHFRSFVPLVQGRGLKFTVLLLTQCNALFGVYAALCMIYRKGIKYMYNLRNLSAKSY